MKSVCFFVFAAFSASAFAAEDPSYSYSPIQEGQARRDPFKTYSDELAVITDDTYCKRSKVACVRLDDVKLQAIVSGTATPRAMLAMKDGSSIVLRTGDVIGWGIVKAIRSNSMLVEQTYRAADGRLIKHLVVLSLR